MINFNEIRAKYGLPPLPDGGIKEYLWIYPEDLNQETIDLVEGKDYEILTLKQIENVKSTEKKETGVGS